MPRELREWHTGRKSHNLGVLKKYISTEDFRPGVEKKGAGRRETRCHATQDGGFVPDGPKLRVRECTQDWLKSKAGMIPEERRKSFSAKVLYLKN